MKIILKVSTQGTYFYTSLNDFYYSILHFVLLRKFANKQRKISFNFLRAFFF